MKEIVLKCADCGEVFQEVSTMFEILNFSGNTYISCPVCESNCFHVTCMEAALTAIRDEIG